MSEKRGLWVLLLGVVLVGWWSVTAAAGPLDQLFSFTRVEADPDKPYRLSAENGPWMIMACTFSGEQAERQAHELVIELRKRYKLEAYTYNKRFDLEDRQYGLGWTPRGERKTMKHVKYRDQPAEFDEVAVLVGNYRSVDDSEAQATLKKIKYTEPDCLKLDRDKPTSRTLAALRLMQKTVLSVGNPKKKRGPMGHALITTNPLAPKDYFAPGGLDPLVVKANEGVEHCLLDCPSKYTVQVATFRGTAVINQREIADITSGFKRAPGEKLVEAAKNAHRLTQALRLKGWEAYEFHDRYASIVTVGSFNWDIRRLPNGQPETNPAIRTVIESFGAGPSQFGAANGGVTVKTVIGIPLDPQPKLVHVPKRSLSAQYAQGGGVRGLF
ncbi:MAG: hypothetical protein ACYTG0_25735 [Planctomycetota bacterium]|jgi:hypothetical protein